MYVMYLMSKCHGKYLPKLAKDELQLHSHKNLVITFKGSRGNSSKNDSLLRPDCRLQGEQYLITNKINITWLTPTEHFPYRY